MKKPYAKDNFQDKIDEDKDDLKDNDKLKDKDDLDDEDDFKNKEDLRNKGDLEKEDDLKTKSHCCSLLTGVSSYRGRGWGNLSCLIRAHIREYLSQANGEKCDEGDYKQS